MRLSLFKEKQHKTNNQNGNEQPEGTSLFNSLKRGLSKTHEILTIRIDDLILGKKEIDQDLFEELEEILISSDLGINATHKLMEHVQSKVKRGEAERPELVKRYHEESIYHLLENNEQSLRLSGEPPFVIMVVGVNGTGKTTTIAKMAHQYRSHDKRVLLVAADTFRAAAIDQLEIWSQRVGCDFFKQASGADPSAVVYDAMKTSKKKGIDIVIIDTAGRMHTKINLMEELKKIKRVAGREHHGAPHETLLVIDATTGQNALSQAALFRETIDISGIALTKLDGTSKGGIIIAISDEFKIPIRFIGIGENHDDLKQFKAREYVDALFCA